jgi:hypothetical protein
MLWFKSKPQRSHLIAIPIGLCFAAATESFFMLGMMMNPMTNMTIPRGTPIPKDGMPVSTSATAESTATVMPTPINLPPNPASLMCMRI